MVSAKSSIFTLTSQVIVAHSFLHAKDRDTPGIGSVVVSEESLVVKSW